MNALTKLELLLQIVRWQLTWKKHDLDYRDPSLPSDKFLTAREVAARIPDGATVSSSGMAAHARCSIFFWALREAFLSGGHPRDLTWLSVSAHGGRGRAPGTIEELALPGLITRQIAGHPETKKANLKLAAEGKVELHTMPQGQMTFAIEAQAHGRDTVPTETGVGTFLDPRVGRGSEVTDTGAPSLVTVEGDKLRYRLPTIDHCFFVAPYADREGNIYMRTATTLTETLEGALAARRNGGKVYASVYGIIPKDEKNIFLRADQVDGIVVNPWSEQTGAVPQREYWPLFTPETTIHPKEGIDRLRFVNRVLRITPVRGPVEDALARLAACLFTHVATPGSLINIGVGLPEEAARLVVEGGLGSDVTFFTETGVVGGLPSPGIYFGSAVRPLRQMTSAQVFHLAYDQLDTAMFGILQADSEGNVNVSKRGEGIATYVGPGGLPDLAAAARKVIFVGKWKAGVDMQVQDGELRLGQGGTPKFVERVDEITFSGQHALAQGKEVYYVTNVGVFHLTKRGMELVEVVPGIDVRRDIVDATPMRIVLPSDHEIPVVPPHIMTGDGFRLAWTAGCVGQKAGCACPAVG